MKQVKQTPTRGKRKIILSTSESESEEKLKRKPKQQKKRKECWRKKQLDQLKKRQALVHKYSQQEEKGL